MASLMLVKNVVGELQPKRTLAASRGFLAAARLSCIISYHLARCCYDNIGSLCDIYKLAVKNLVDSPKRLVKELFWREFERSYIV